MKTILSMGMVLALAVGAQGAEKKATYKSLKFPPLNQVKVPTPVRFQLANGMVVYLVEDHELPTISASANIRAGSRWEPQDKTGLAGIAGSVMRTGGSTTRSGDKLDEELDRLGASVETGIGEDSGNAGVSVLKEDIDTGLTILADLLQHPAFPQDKIDLAKITAREGIARRNDDADGIASREFERVVMGRNSAYGRIPEYATIESITRDDLLAFHKRFFQPENVILGVWGDFQAAEMRAKIEKIFGSWARGGQPVPAVPALEPGAPGIYSINKDDVNQSNVYMGFVAGKRNDPDYYALSVASAILGEGFSGRLMSRVRTAQGLAYHVGAAWQAGWDRPGMFMATGGTKSGSTAKIINSIRTEIGKMAEGVTDEEMARAKDSILKGVAFDSDSTGKVVRRLMTYEYYGYPSDYLQQYRTKIEKVTKDDVARVSGQYLKTDKLAILVLGKEKEFDQPLSTLGKVTPVDITIPKPAQKAVEAATPESIAKGKALLMAARQAAGGDAVMAVKDYTESGSVSIVMPQGEMAIKRETTQSLAGRVLNKMTLPFGEILQGFDGQVLWMKTPQGVQEMPAAQKEEAAGELFRDLFWLLQNFESDKLTVQALETVQVDGKPADGVAISDPARKLLVKLYLDAATHLAVKKVYVGSMMGAPGEMEEIYSDYRETAGVKSPFKSVVFQAGKKKAEQTTTDLKINPNVPESAYKKP